MKRKDDDYYLDLESLTGYLGLGRTTLRGLIASGQVPAYQPGNKLLVKKSEFDRYMATCKVRSFDRVKEVVAEVIERMK